MSMPCSVLLFSCGSHVRRRVNGLQCFLADYSQLHLARTLTNKTLTLFKWSASTNKSMILLLTPQMFVQIRPLHHCPELHI